MHAIREFLISSIHTTLNSNFIARHLDITNLYGSCVKQQHKTIHLIINCVIYTKTNLGEAKLTIPKKK